MFETSHPSLNPLWRRILVVVVALGWAGFEQYNGNTGWAMLFLAFGAWMGWSLLIAYVPAPEADASKTRERDGKDER
ncbi:hypothetical protein DYI37_10620 [Fulvimarina endophytica]|uniref:DUF3329 domain-containing protein n=1 Tax=Fulvimarina endophytica TaxID=2293836 RepID=A0A371X2N6_9HYPH|nr:hypothetical protein [Fulvimarina endophytica]RFC63473.1 hypothetical protein DYI37_10620 [Fulvimarina endophytica]